MIAERRAVRRREILMSKQLIDYEQFAQVEIRAGKMIQVEIFRKPVTGLPDDHQFWTPGADLFRRCWCSGRSRRMSR